jgi:hypothetical protein
LLLKGASSSLSWILVVGLVIPLKGLGETLTAVQIAEKARLKDLENLKKYGATSCRLIEVKEELDEKGVTEERDVKALTLSLSSAPIPGGKETQRISPQIHREKIAEDISVLDRLHWFDWKLEKEEDALGEACYRLAFSPKYGVRTSGARELILSRSRGRCWVAKRDYSKMRLEGRLIRPVEMAGFLVTVREVDYLTTSRRLQPMLAVPEQIRYRFRVEVFPAFEFHERHTQKFDFGDAAKSMASPKDQKGGMAGLN